MGAVIEAVSSLITYNMVRDQAPEDSYRGLHIYCSTRT